VGPRAVLDAVVKRKIPSPRWESNPRIPNIGRKKTKFMSIIFKISVPTSQKTRRISVTKKSRLMFRETVAVCLFVCLFVCFQNRTKHFDTLYG
jgi:hypothetical protein